MRNHLTDDMLMEALEGTASAECRRHVADCAECAVLLREAAGGLDLAAAADVPEPPPLYWEVFRRQVGSRIGEEAPARRPYRFLPALAVAAGLLIAFGVFRAQAPRAAPQPVPTLPAWSALPPAEEDEGFAVLQAYAAGGDTLESALPSQDVNGVLADLSEDESQELADTLHRELTAAEAL
jgi:hypothetical protein